MKRSSLLKATLQRSTHNFMKPRLIFLVGPTAIGKTEVGVELARKLDAEIISCDSMQVYQGMDIISSKPSGALRKKVPHHLIDIISPAKEFNASMYRKKALFAIKDIIKRGKTPLLVGGTGLYMSILIDGIFDFKTKGVAIREKLFKLSERKGSPYLHKKLQKVDPVAAGKIHPNDTKRIVRALEVFEVAGKPITQLQKQRKGLSDTFEIDIFCINMTREDLNKRIDARVARMFKMGLIEEARKLLKAKLGKTAGFAIGIRELKKYFDADIDLETAKELIKKNTRLYAKRQLTWFRKDKRIKWISISESDKPKKIANLLWKELS